MLDAMEAPLEHEYRHPDGGQRHAQVAAHPEQLEAGGDAGELGAGGADVGHHQRGEGHRRQPYSEPLTYETDHALPGDHPHAGPEVVEQDEGDRGQQQDPQELVAVFGAEGGVGGDPGRIVIGEPGQEPRPDNADQHHQRQAAR